MEENLESKFLEQLNANIGIAHKVCNLYLDDQEEKADLLQEMFYQLWKSFPNFSARSKFSTWMYTVCFNTAITFFKKNQKSKKESISSIQNDMEIDSKDDYEEKLETLYVLVESLTPINKSIILLYIEGFKNDEISEITGLSKTNISVRLVRIKEELKKIRKTLDI